MTNTISTPTKSIIKVTEGVMSGDVFYGSFDTIIDGKRLSVTVSNFLKDIHDTKGTPHSVIAGYKKDALINIQVKGESGHWFNVFTTKGGKWNGIDKGFLEVMTVGDMRSSHPKMCDMNIWDFMGAKTWADKAFTQN